MRDREDMTGVERCRCHHGHVGLLPLMTAKEVLKDLLWDPKKAVAAKPTDVTDSGKKLLYYGVKKGAVVQKASDLALELSDKLGREIQPPVVVLASALASEFGSQKPIIEKVAYTKSIVAHAKAAGKRPFAYLTPKGELGRAGSGGRVLSTDKEPTFEDVAIAERVLGGLI